MQKVISYREGYKYQLAETYMCAVGIKPEKTITTDYVTLSRNGILYIIEGYAWDGPSGPTIDTKSSMRGSLVHDALYQLLREGKLPPEARSVADDLLYNICVEDGMWKWRAWLWRREVKKFAADAASPLNDRAVLIAP